MAESMLAYGVNTGKQVLDQLFYVVEHPAPSLNEFEREVIQDRFVALQKHLSRTSISEKQGRVIQDAYIKCRSYAITGIQTVEGEVVKEFIDAN